MKKYLYFVIIGILPICGFSQKNKQESKIQEVFTEVDTMPEFNGGEEALLKFFNQNSSFTFFEKRKSGTTVSVNFLVLKDGTISNIKVLVTPNDDVKQEIIRLIQNMPKWNPGIRTGKKVNVSTNLLVYMEQ